MHTRFKRALILLVAPPLAMAVWLAKWSGPPPSLVMLGLQSYTNEMAVVTITNLSQFVFTCVLEAERKTDGQWPTYAAGDPLRNSGAEGVGLLRPGQVLTSSLPVMAYTPPCPWRVSVFCLQPAFQGNSIRGKSYYWLAKCGVRGLARKVCGVPGDLRVSGPEMAQREK